MNAKSDELVVNGGSPVRADAGWPVWPDYGEGTEANLLAALRSNRWSVSWHSTGWKSLERVFAEQFARYNRSAYCVSVDHGSSALLIALESLDLGPGDEVIVPVLTWVAPVTAVLRVGAVPILVDVDPRSGCMSADGVSAALTDRTKAVIVVHLACTVADLGRITAVASNAGIAVIEDCSQAHGAQWGTQRVGTIGDLGVFSLGASKILAGGEGGAVITDDCERYSQLQMLRADSRRYDHANPEIGKPELVEDGAIMGANYCMSEFAAGVLLDQLERLDVHNETRQMRANQLEQILVSSNVFKPIPVPPQVTKRSIYEFGMQIEPALLGKRSICEFSYAVSMELGIKVYPPRAPLNRSVLLRPTTKRRYRSQWSLALERGGLAANYAGAESYVARTMLFHHSILLGTQRDIDDIAAAMEKVSHAYSKST